MANKKTTRAQAHAFIRANQKPDTEAIIEYVQDDETKTIPVIIRNSLTFGERITFIEDAVHRCVSEGEYFPASKRMAFNISALKFLTDIGQCLKGEELGDFLSCFDIETFLKENSEAAFQLFLEMKNEVDEAIEWEKAKILNQAGVNGIFVALSELIKKIDTALDSVTANIDEHKIEEMLGAIKVFSESPDKVAQAVIDNERKKIIQTNERGKVVPIAIKDGEDDAIQLE